METSTPIAKTPSKRHSTSLLRDITNSLFKRRKLSNIINQSVTAQAEVDDELERSLRRSEAELRGRFSSIGSPGSSLVLDEKEMRDHFQICLKMYAENKINAKNAWNLKIIDYMRTILYSQGLNKDSLQVAGTSLDASVKIYGIRVDDVHMAVLQLANNMARLNTLRDAEDAEQHTEGNDPLESDKPRENEQPRRKKRRVMVFEQKPTLVKDPNSLLDDIVKLKSVFFQTHINLESSIAENLYTNRIYMNHSKYKFMLLSKEKAWPSYNKKDASINFNTKYPFKVSKIKNFKICAPLTGFEIDEWDPDTESLLFAERSRIVNNELNEEVVYDEDGIPIPELDGSVHNLFADAEETINRVAQHAVITKRVAHIVDFNPAEQSIRIGDYGYLNAVINNKLITQVWAGPSHWKFKHIKRTEPNFPEHPEKQVRKTEKRNRIQSSLIDFNTGILPFDKTKLYKPKKVRIDISSFRCTLPKVIYFEYGIHRRLMLKPVYIRLDRYNDKSDNEESKTMNDTNPNHSSHSHIENSHTDDGNHEDHQDQDLTQSVILSREDFQNRNLIDMPELVPKYLLSYALRAKRMNMKKLKTAIWKTLISTGPNEKVPDTDMYKREVHKKNFSDVYKEIPARISKKMQQELSCPLAFVALLNLCNEQNLKLIGQSNLQDFTIEKAELSDC
ncbi:hypothetical protein ILUMI_10266 [Ignelater luminosus]|uniref:Condensin complex subunit 2 n=1 Tax=Ignelater luminosus TaxID=2038154 RepID=A0A8K0D485_IGNLU|nr:hypothetical protein ILUMI_10266 [Ignelater luminosus]